MSEEGVTTSEDLPLGWNLGYNIKLDHLLRDGATFRGVPIQREEPNEKDRDNDNSLIPIRREGSEGPYLEWEYAADRHYTLTSTTFTERQLYKHEFHKDFYGDLMDYIAWSRERLENEKDALIFIAENTTIPVPKVLNFSVENDVASLTTSLVDGIPMNELRETLSGEDDATLVSNVSSYINDTLLPQLNNLKSNTLGTVRGNFIPTRNLEHAYLPDPWEREGHGDDGTDHPCIREEYGRKRYPWPSVTSATKDYVYCHNELYQWNILADPKTLQVTAILGWESSGFFLPGFEFPYWHESNCELRNSTERGGKNPMIRPHLELIFGPSEAARAPILQQSPSLTGHRCKVPAWQPIVCQCASP